MLTGKRKYEIYGVVGLVIVLITVLLIGAAYQQVFSRFVTVTIRTDRAGLLLQVDSDVSLHSVRVGKVSDVRTDGSDGAVITAELDPSQVRYIPADVTAQIISPTVFGPKYVDLVPPAQPTNRIIAAGAVVQPTGVQVEANLVFENLMSLLGGVHPDKINVALGAVSTALQGRGKETGKYLSDLNAYLREFNTHLPELRNDLATAPDVINAYADAAPDIVRIIDNFTTTGDTIVEKQAALDGFLISLTQFGDKTADFLDKNHQPLVNALDVLRPTTASLERYAPMFPCFFAGVNHERKVQEPSFGGVVPGLRTLTSFQPGIGPYEYPENLPKLGVDEPSCFGGLVEGATVPRHVTFDDGSPDLKTRDRPVSVRPPSLATMLFGAAAAEAGR